MRAHEESLTKGRRIRAAWDNKRNRAVAEGTPLTKRTPGWLVLGANGKLRIEPRRAAIVRRIFKLTLSGVGQHAIAETLNREKVKPFQASLWHRSYVKKLLENPAVMGTLIAYRVEHEKGRKVRKPAVEVPNHFPAVVSEADWKRVASMREGNAAVVRARAPKGGAVLQNILAGLAKCPTCGGTMTRVSKGPTGGYAYLTCARAKLGAGCKYRNIRMENVEAAVLTNMEAVLGGMPTGNAETDTRLNEIEVSLGVLRDQASNVAAAIAARGTTGVLGAQLNTIEAEMAKLEAEQRQLIAANEDAPMLDLKVLELEKEIARPTPDRGRVNALLRQMVRAVVIDHTNGRLVFQWRHGGESHLVFAMPKLDA
ncbi:recombinase family protein [Reyranella sp.]|uniref:recombinase family protein n=1 Tax=Reyranella sp. TaxID=1929291 RepID=UPI004036E546